MVTISIGFVYLLACLTPFISPVSFWPLAFVALGFPYVVLVLTCFIITWFFVNKRISGYLLIVLFAGFQNLFAVFGLHYNQKMPLQTKHNTLRVLTWNVRNFNSADQASDPFKITRKQMLEYIKNSNADVLCLQEFVEDPVPPLFSNTKALATMGFRYYYKSNEIFRHFSYGSLYFGTAIFSKLPVVSCSEILLGDSSFPEHLIRADIVFHNRPLRIFSTHLKSYNLFATPADSTNHLLLHNKIYPIYMASKFEKLKIFSQEHVLQAKIVKAELEKSPYPFIYAADMNSVPASFAYHFISHGLQDAFLQKGFGIGSTYNALNNTLRIDYLFADKHLSINTYQKDEIYLSDHFPQIVDLDWK